MAMKRWIVGIVLIFLFGNGGKLAAVSKRGTSVAQFLKIGVGARAAAMGGAFLALANDVSALYWNPAGIAGLPKASLMATHTRWFADLNHDFLGVVLPVSRAGNIGVSITSFSAPEMEQTTYTQPEGTGIYFDVQDLALGVTYARWLTDRFRFGLTGKLVHQRLFNEVAQTFAVDIGGLLRTGVPGLQLGMVMTNFGGKMRLDGRDLIVSYDKRPDVAGNPLIEAKLSTESWPLPTSFRVGIAWSLWAPQQALHASDTQTIIVTMEGYHVNDAAETLDMGIEYGWKGILFFRGGYRINHDTERWSVGTGVHLPLGNWHIKADYALTQMLELGYVQRIQLELSF